MAYPSMELLLTYKLRSAVDDPPYWSFRKLTSTVCVPLPKLPMMSNNCEAPDACDAVAVWMPPICVPSTPTTNSALP